MRRRTVWAAIVTALLTAALGTAATTASGGSTIMVDADGRATPASCDAGGAGTAKKTIEAGIAAAPAGATVLVCPGTYVEQVDITGTNGLTVRSVRPWKATIQAPTALGGPFVVGIYGADDITFQWFTVVTRATPGCDTPEAGILAVAAKNVVIRSNRVRNLGQTYGDCAFPIGILAGYGPIIGTAATALPAGIPADARTTGTIAYNAVQDHRFIGIAAINTLGPGPGQGSTTMLIAHNSVRYFHLGTTTPDCTTSAAAGLTRQAASVLRSLPAAVPLFCPSVGIYVGTSVSDSPTPGAGATVEHNRVLSGPHALPVATAGAVVATPLQAVGILVVDGRHTDGGVTVQNNHAFRNFLGVVAVDAAGVQIRDNRTDQDIAGIAVWDTEGATVHGNTATSDQVGINLADVPFDGSPQPWYITSGVHVTGNAATGNGQSCTDTTLGGGTLGTDNLWTSNTGELDSSSPAGICGPATPP